MLYLSLKREYTLAEYLRMVKDPKLRKVLFASHIHSVGFPSAITIKGVHNAAMPKYGVCHNDDVTQLLIWLCLMSALSMHSACP